MASTVNLPAALSEALGYMQRSIACPEDVKARIVALRVPVEDVPGTRMTTSWRSATSHDAGGGGWRHNGGGSSGSNGGGSGRWNSGGGGPRHSNNGGTSLVT